MRYTFSCIVAVALVTASGSTSFAQAVVINELLGSTTSADSEFIELFNTTASAVDIGDWMIELWDSDSSSLGGADGSSPYTIPSGTSLNAGGHFLLGNSTFSTTYGITPDLTLPANAIENSSYTVVLADSSNVVQNAIFVTDGGAGDTANRAGAAITPESTIGPDGSFLPAGFTRTVDGGGSFSLLEFSPQPAPSATPEGGDFTVVAPPAPPSDLVISGVIDGPLSGGIPKAIELTATADIPDLSIYGIGSANNGGGSDGEELTLSGSASAGDRLYIASESTGFDSFFGFVPDFVDSAASINGDDAIELFLNGDVVDVFGDINVDGTGQPWEYTDGWAYRVDGTGNDGDMFILSNWFFSGPNALDGESTNATAATPFPVGTFAPARVPEPASITMWIILGIALAGGACLWRRNAA